MVREVTTKDVKDASLKSVKINRQTRWLYISFFQKGVGCCWRRNHGCGERIFNNDQLLTEINHTIIALLPKVATRSKVID